MSERGFLALLILLAIATGAFGTHRLTQLLDAVEERDRATAASWR